MKCSFCGKEIELGEGKVYVTREGDITYLCSSKCEKNLKLKRKPQRVKWTARYEYEKRVRSGEEKKVVKAASKEKKKKTTRADRKKARDDKKAAKKKKMDEIKKMKKSGKAPEKKEETKE